MAEPKLKLFDNLRDRFEEGGLPYLPSVEQNKYYDSEDFEPVAGGVVNGQPVIQAANVTEYDANIDVNDRKQPFINDHSLDYSRLDLRGPENDNTYGPESGYYGGYESRTGTFKDYE